MTIRKIGITAATLALGTALLATPVLAQNATNASGGGSGGGAAQGGSGAPGGGTGTTTMSGGKHIGNTTTPGTSGQ